MTERPGQFDRADSVCEQGRLIAMLRQRPCLEQDPLRAQILGCDAKDPDRAAAQGLDDLDMPVLPFRNLLGIEKADTRNDLRKPIAERAAQGPTTLP